MKLVSSPPPNGVGASPQKARTQVLRFHPEPHCTFEIDLSTEDGWHRLIGKVYATDRQDVYQVMQALRVAGFGPEEEFSIPRAVAYLPSLRLLLQERIHGTSAKDIFKCGETRAVCHGCGSMWAMVRAVPDARPAVRWNFRDREVPRQR